MRIALEAMGKYSELSSHVPSARRDHGTEADFLADMIERSKQERDRAISEYEEHILEHRVRWMTA
jgi:hypothetical protein